MAALTIAAANVSLDTGAHDGDQIAGEAFSAGALLYRKSADGRWYKAQCDGTPEEAGAYGTGMALSTADAAGARVTIARPGAAVSIGAAACAAGIVYCPGRTAGTLVPTADMASTDKVTVAAMGISTSKLLLLYGYNAGAVIA